MHSNLLVEDIEEHSSKRDYRDHQEAAAKGHQISIEFRTNWNSEMACRHGVLAVVVVLLSSCMMGALAYQKNHYGHSYAKSCPQADLIVSETLKKHYNLDKSIVAGVLRLHFHDCFVNGCDASILLESTPTDGTDVERFALPNLKSARGFEVINDAKARLEAACPGVVSCADTLAMAARDSSVLLGGLYYNVPTGRYDGRVSSKTLADESLPSPNMDMSQLKRNFQDKGMSVQDLVLLSGGHTIGTSKCSVVESRIYNFSNTGKPDPSLNPAYLAQLRQMCPQGANQSPVVALDKGSQFSFDNSYYKNLVNRNGLLTSDQVLAGSAESVDLVSSLAQNPRQFYVQFTQSMIKMGNIGWKTRKNGEIRRQCTVVNPTSTARAATL